MRKQCCQIGVQVVDWATFRAGCHFINKLCFLRLLKYLLAQHMRGSTLSNLDAQPLAYFKRLRSETEIQRTEIEKMTMPDESYVLDLCEACHVNVLTQ